jgi:hypothetical protein
LGVWRVAAYRDLLRMPFLNTDLHWMLPLVIKRRKPESDPPSLGTLWIFAGHVDELAKLGPKDWGSRPLGPCSIQDLYSGSNATSLGAAASHTPLATRDPPPNPIELKQAGVGPRSVLWKPWAFGQAR